MKRLRIAVILLAGVAVLCTVNHLAHHRRIDRVMSALDRIEELAREGDTPLALQTAEAFAREYQTVGDRISFYVAHSELRESRETAAMLPTLLRQGSDDELYREIARLREQLRNLRQVDDPLLRNIL